MKKPVIALLAVVVVIAAAVGGWLWYQSQQDRGLTLYGNVDIRTVNMSFRVGGRLASLAVDEGDAIKAGQVLGTLDRAPYENALMQALRISWRMASRSGSGALSSAAAASTSG